MASLIEIYDHFQREAQIHLWTFMASLMIIFDQKKREAQNIYDFIDDHFWQKKSRITRIHPKLFWSIQAIHDLTFNL